MPDQPYWWRSHDLPHPPPEWRYRSDRWRLDDERGRREAYDDDDERAAHEDRRHRSWAEKSVDEVKSWLGGERAERRRDRDRLEHRRRDDYRGVGPRTSYEEDDRLRDRLCRRLADDPELDASELVVRVIDNEAILDGVASRRDAARAFDIALDTPGVVHVRDRIRRRQRRRS